MKALYFASGVAVFVYIAAFNTEFVRKWEAKISTAVFVGGFAIVLAVAALALIIGLVMLLTDILHAIGPPALFIGLAFIVAASMVVRALKGKKP